MRFYIRVNANFTFHNQLYHCFFFQLAENFYFVHFSQILCYNVSGECVNIKAAFTYFGSLLSVNGRCCLGELPFGSFKTLQL